MKKNSFYLISLGCAKNTVDSNMIGTILTKAGYTFTEKPGQAEILIVNTCGFIKPAREEAVETIRDLSAKKHDQQLLIAAGCMAERFADEIIAACPKVDGLLGTRSITKIRETINNIKKKRGIPISSKEFQKNFDIPQAAQEGASAYVKIGDGCSRRCAFCSIPLIKGEWQSRPVQDILQDVKSLDQAGLQELILIAQDTTAYGIDRGEKDALPGLLEKVLITAPNIPWIRILYAFPGFVSDRLIDLLGGQNAILPYLDIPLQHASPAVLRRMRRPDDMGWVRETIAKMREKAPGIAIRSTFITGFPGETEEDFSMLYRFIEEMRFDRVGVFPYYSESGTPSAELIDDVPEEVKQDRLEQIMVLQQGISHEINTTFIGSQLNILIEGEQEGLMVGRSYRDAPEIDGLVFLHGSAEIGQIVPVRITGVMGDYDLLGKIIKKTAH